jgi:hypothetical protein
MIKYLNEIDYIGNANCITAVPKAVNEFFSRDPERFSAWLGMGSGERSLQQMVFAEIVRR